MIARRRKPAADPKKKIGGLEHRLNEALQQQAATADVLKVISRSTFDLQSVLDTLVKSATRLCEAQDAFIFLPTGGNVFRAAARHGFTPEFHQFIESNPPTLDRGSVVGRTAIEGRVVHSSDVLAEPNYTRHDAQRISGFRAALGVPLLREGKVVGVIFLSRTKPQPFTDKQIALVTTFADQAVIAIENTRLFEAEQQRTRELSESLQQQTATSEVLSIISSSPGELEPVFQSMLENATRICGAKFGVLWQAEGEGFRTVAAYGLPPKFADERRRTPLIHPSGDDPLGILVRTRQPFHIADIRTLDSYIRGFPPLVALADIGGARTLLSAPMLKDGEVVGAIAIYRQEMRPFTDKQIELVANFAAQAIIAIENTRLLNELRESLQQQTATADVLKVISRSTFDLQSVLNTLVASAASLCEADKGAIMMRKGEVYRIQANYGFAPEAIQWARDNPVLPDRGSATGRATLEGKAIHIPDVLIDPDYQATGYQQAFAYRSILSVPLLREGAAVGVFNLTRDKVKPFTNRQIELVTAFADQAVIAIENVRLFEAEQQRTRELSESLERQTATSDVLRVISSSTGDLMPVFEAMLQNAVRICGAEFGNLMLREGDAFRVGATHGAPAAYVDFVHREGPFRIDPRLGLGRMLQTKQTYQVADLVAAPTHGDKLRIATIELAGARTVLGVPMLKDDDMVGSIIIYRREVRPFTDKQIELVQNFAAQAVIAIENARLLNELRLRTDDLSEALEQQTATSEVLKVISSSPGELEPVFQAMLENAIRICEAKFGTLFRFDGEKFHLAAQFGTPAEFAEFQRRRNAFRPTPGSLLDGVMQTKRMSYTADNAAEPVPGDVTRLGGARSFVSVPMLKEGDLVGTINIYRQEVRPFTDKQIALVENFASQAVIAIENTRLLSELRESLERQTATADVLKVISRSTFDLRTVLDTLVESAARLCEADQAAITQPRDDVLLYAASFGFPQGFIEIAKRTAFVPGSGTITGRVLLEGKPVQIDDVLADPEYNFEGQKAAGFRTALGVPLLREDESIGVMVLLRSQVRPFTAKQTELVTTFADQAVIAIENARLFEAEQRRTRELGKSLEDLRTAQDRLVQTQKLASLGQLTAGIAHEIKNPLNFVNNFSGVSVELIDELQETLGRVNADKKTREEIAELADTLRDNLDKIVQHGKRADSIVKNMLLHSREGSGERRLVDVNAIVEESLNLAYHGARAEKQGFNVTLERSFDPMAGEIDAFPQEITRVLLNLISNGFYAATNRQGQESGNGFEPTITAATKSLGDRVEIRIRDNGIGIPPEVREKLFNPFFTTKPAGEGTGLGLSISHDIVVKQHAGSIEVDTEPGQFTEFRIILPRTAA
jgi:GAF domain-containing protein